MSQAVQAYDCIYFYIGSSKRPSARSIRVVQVSTFIRICACMCVRVCVCVCARACAYVLARAVGSGQLRPQCESQRRMREDESHQQQARLPTRLSHEEIASVRWEK
eukprot:4823306-Amphidinium_carterae.1